MKLTKYEHACAVIEEDEQTLILDPGVFSRSFPPETLTNAAAAIVTHNHPDHFDRKHLTTLLAQNPGVTIYAPEDVTDPLGHIPITHVAPGDTVTVGPFTLSFGGGEHAVIDEDIPAPKNLTVTINQTVYYPGDSFVLPEQNPEIILTPIIAPWSKISETIDFIQATHAHVYIPTHDALLSADGHSVYDRIITPVAERENARYIRLAIGDAYVL